MQPYFFPYIGYFQLMNAVDKFVIYDNIQYTKKGWINRNRLLQNGGDATFTIPIKNDSDYLNINKRFLSDNSLKERKKILRKIESNYKKAPYFNLVFPQIEKCMLFEKTNLFEFIVFSINEVIKLLDIKTEIIISSSIDIDRTSKGQDKVIAICKEIRCNNYINAIGGQKLYDTQSFAKENIKLDFLKSKNIVYPQFNNGFIPWLSIIDVMMFNSSQRIREMLEEYDLV